MKHIFGFLTGMVILIAAVYFSLILLDAQFGTMLDWGIGLVSVIWLTIIVTVPWDAHFRAKEVLDDAKISERKDILVIEESLEYVRKVAKRSLIIAVSLHILTAVGLFFVAYTGLSTVGYFSAGAAVLLTFLRPSVKFYEYLQERLALIRQEFRYPREDVRELLSQTEEMNQKIEALEETLGTDPEKQSWRLDIEKLLSETNEKLLESERLLQEKIAKSDEMLTAVDSKYKEENETIRNEIRKHFERTSTDLKLLENVREIAGFIRELKS